VKGIKSDFKSCYIYQQYGRKSCYDILYSESHCVVCTLRKIGDDITDIRHFEIILECTLSDIKQETYTHTPRMALVKEWSLLSFETNRGQFPEYSAYYQF
jgi:hypothetical protein